MTVTTPEVEQPLATERKAGAFRRASAFLHRHRGIRLSLVLGPPMGWMLVVYLGALALLFLSAFWRQDPLTSLIQRHWNVDNFRTLWRVSVYRTIAIRTIGIAAAVTITDIILALPIAYYAARIARPRAKTALLLAVVMPLWSSYLIRVYAWRVILASNGLLDWTTSRLHIGTFNFGFSNWSVWIVFCYLWLPYVILPIYAALERVPHSFIEASGDLGAHWRTTLRRVILPMAMPGIVAGSIFAFALTLGDYIVPSLAGNTQFLGNVVYESVGVANNVPFAAAYALVPVVIMGLYLLGARKLNAFEAL
jgi:putative spermidine/putrescine transport system permease protein